MPRAFRCAEPGASAACRLPNPGEHATRARFTLFDRDPLTTIFHLYLEPLPREANLIRCELHQGFGEIRSEGASWGDEGIVDRTKRFKQTRCTIERGEPRASNTRRRPLVREGADNVSHNQPSIEQIPTGEAERPGKWLADAVVVVFIGHGPIRSPTGGTIPAAVANMFPRPQCAQDLSIRGRTVITERRRNRTE